MRFCGLTLACLWVVGCGGNGSTPPPETGADARPAGRAAYPVPVYVQQVPVYPPPAQAAPSWSGGPNTAMQPAQPFASAQGQYPSYPGQSPAQYPAQQQYAPPAPVQQSGGYNPWAIQAQRQHQANGWAASQPWGGAVQQHQQQSATGAYQYRPLESDARQTPQVAAPYDHPFGSSQRPVTAMPGYGAYAGGYAGAWPGYGGQYGGWPGGQYGGWPGGQYGGWPGGWGGMPNGGGFPGMWPGMW
ncbi:MAG: hypothetical protein OQL11_01625 [Gammaproteobacteria bacterium]|nr:hypothetical protein [Gammaproteobacteria bacterium]